VIDIGSTYRESGLFERIYQVGLVLMLIISSGFPMFVNHKGVDMLVFAYAVAGAVYFKPNLSWVLKFTFAFALLMFIQAIYFGEFYIKTSIYQVILFCGAAMSVAILNTNLLYIYVRVMKVIAVIATVLFIPILINPGFAETLISASPFHVQKVAEAYGWESTSHNIFVMHFPPDFFYGLIRNSGPFWEPGAFGGFLVLAFLFNTLIHNTLLRKENIIFIAAILTTFSTTTYLALIFFVAAFSFVKLNDHVIKWGALLVFIAAGAFFYDKLDFLGEKITKEVQETKQQAFVRGGDTRMASAYLDLKEISDNSFHVFFGRGSHPDTRIKGIDKEVLRTNGITDLLSRFGLIFFIFAIFSLYKSFRLITELGNGKTNVAFVALGTMLILAFSEIYFIYIFFKVLILFQMSSVRVYKEPDEYDVVRPKRRMLLQS
jgi:hypothetical protein